MRDEVATILLGIRSGLTPLTTEVVQRLGAAERDVDERLTAAVSELRRDLAVVFEVMSGLQHSLTSAGAGGAERAASAVDVRD